MHVTQKIFRDLFPRADIGFVAPLNEQMEDADINNLERVSCFLAQVGHECAEFTRFEENLNYGKAGLLAIFGKYFTEEQAEEYHRKPEMIANRVYANRMGNGDEASGDGWHFRGRGCIQLTGMNNYIAFKEATKVDVINHPEFILKDKRLTIRVGTWFWTINRLNEVADSRDFKSLTRRINGGYNGLEHRLELYDRAKELLSPQTQSAEPGWNKYRS